jgi:hypothetical protein
VELWTCGGKAAKQIWNARDVANQIVEVPKFTQYNSCSNLWFRSVETGRVRDRTRLGEAGRG